MCLNVQTQVTKDQKHLLVDEKCQKWQRTTHTKPVIKTKSDKKYKF